jgi:hypothetical protein
MPKSHCSEPVVVCVDAAMKPSSHSATMVPTWLTLTFCPYSALLISTPRRTRRKRVSAKGGPGTRNAVLMYGWTGVGSVAQLCFFLTGHWEQVGQLHVCKFN